jgi:hypothetical protein
MFLSHHLEWLNTVKYKNNTIEYILLNFFKIIQLYIHSVVADCDYLVGRT